MKLNETKRNINFELLKMMRDKGFTVNETAEYFNCPLDTISYYMRTRKFGKFARYKKGKDDERILDALEVQGLSQTQASKILGIKQCNISKRYKSLKRFRELKKERYEWLKKWQDANAVEEN